MLYSFWNSLRQKNILVFVKVGAIALAFLVLLFLLWPGKNYDRYKAVEITTQGSSSSHYVHNSKLYGYNGIAFYSVDIGKESSPTILQSGLKLPKVDQIVWANEAGALVTFKAPLYSSEVSKALEAINEKVTNRAENYTWYIDFKKGSLSLFDTSKYNQDSALFSATTNGFYYYNYVFETEKDESWRDTFILYFYNSQSGEKKEVSNEFKATAVLAINNCPAQLGIVCITTRDSTDGKNYSIHSVAEDGHVSKVFTSSAKPKTTNNPDYYVTTENSKAFINRISTKAAKEINLKVAEPDPIVIIGEEVDKSPNHRTIYILDNSLSKEPNSKGENSGYVYASGQINTDNLDVKYKKYSLQIENKDFKERIVRANGYSNDSTETITVDTFKDSVYMLTKETSDLAYLMPLSQEEQKKEVSKCVEDYSKEIQYFPESHSFRLLVDYKLNSDEKTKEFVACLNMNNPRSIYGYTFSVFLVDPDTGRFL